MGFLDFFGGQKKPTKKNNKQKSTTPDSPKFYHFVVSFRYENGHEGTYRTYGTSKTAAQNEVKGMYDNITILKTTQSKQ